MKKIYFLVMVLALTTVSCKKFLSTEPIDKVFADQYYTDEAGLTQALAGVYDALNNQSSNCYYQDMLWEWCEVTTDESFYNSSVISGVRGNNFNTADNIVGTLWNTLYMGIDRANQLIANVNKPVMDEAKRQEILGEALFLRAYYHFILIEYYRNIPLKLTPTTGPENVYIAQSSPADVYAQILKDMTEAESKVYESTAPELGGASSRITKSGIQGILARVCLTMAGAPHNDVSKYAEALKWASKVKNSGQHALNTTFDASLNTAAYTAIPATGANTNVLAFNNNAYAQTFINMCSNKYNIKESIWEVDFKGNNTDGHADFGRVGSTIGIAMSNTAFNNSIGFCYGLTYATARLWESYKPGDLRRDWAIAPFTYSVVTLKDAPAASVIETPYAPANHYRMAGKWRRIYEVGAKDKNNTSINWPILRYSDVLLMLAEASNQVNNGPNAEAITAVNQVRRRAFGLDINTSSVTADLTTAETANKDSFQLAIEKERSLELCFEGFRRLDLIRWGKYVSTMKSVGAEIRNNTQATGLRIMAAGAENAADKYLLYPIPLREMGVNKKLVQNELWR